MLSISPHPLQNKTSQTIIFGHSSDYSWNQNPYGSIFALLPQLELGDEILLELNNQKLIYKVEEKIQTDPSLTEIINRPKKGQQIILSTCYPIGFFSERLNIIASLVSSSFGDFMLVLEISEMSTHTDSTLTYRGAWSGVPLGPPDGILGLVEACARGCTGCELSSTRGDAIWHGATLSSCGASHTAQLTCLA